MKYTRQAAGYELSAFAYFFRGFFGALLAQVFIVDASVAVKWYVEEEDRDKALDVRRDYLEGKIHLRLSSEDTIKLATMNKLCRSGRFGAIISFVSNQ